MREIPVQLKVFFFLQVTNGMVVTLCKPAKQPDMSPKQQKTSPNNKKYMKLSMPQTEENGNVLNSENEVNRQNTERSEIYQSGACGSSNNDNVANQNQLSQCKASNSGKIDESDEFPETQDRANNPRPGLPSVRPNAMKNRQKQLEALLKYEKKFRHSDESHSPGQNNNEPSTSAQETLQYGPNVSPRKSSRTTNISSLMLLHVLDVSMVLQTKSVSWQKLNFNNITGAPEETIFYSLVEGRGELLMFGGIERDIHSLKMDYGFKAHTVNNSLHVLSPLQQLL